MKNVCKHSIGTGLDFSPQAIGWEPPGVDGVGASLRGAGYSVGCVWWFVTLLGGGGDGLVFRSRVIYLHGSLRSSCQAACRF